MARRSQSVVDDLFEMLSWLFTLVHPLWSIPIAVVFFCIPAIWFRYHISLAPLTPIGYVFGAIPALVSLAAGVSGWRRRHERALFLKQHVDVEWLNSLTWQEFEHRVAELHRQDGYLVDEVGGGGADGGIDIRLRRDGLTTVVQCKRWKTFKVGVKPVRELFGVMTAERADRAVFITSGIYTSEAVDFAKGKPITLVDGAQLSQMLRRLQKSLNQSLSPATPTSDQVAQPDAPPAPRCPRCGNAMVLRRAKRGSHAGTVFWGCSMYATTKCGGVRDAGPVNTSTGRTATMF